MKLQTAIDIAQDCELTTIGEALYNIRIHAGNIFVYGEEQDEWDELLDDFNNSKYKAEDLIWIKFNIIKEGEK